MAVTQRLLAPCVHQNHVHDASYHSITAQERGSRCRIVTLVLGPHGGARHNRLLLPGGWSGDAALVWECRRQDVAHCISLWPPPGPVLMKDDTGEPALLLWDAPLATVPEWRSTQAYCYAKTASASCSTQRLQLAVGARARTRARLWAPAWGPCCCSRVVFSPGWLLGLGRAPGLLCRRPWARVALALLGAPA